MKDPRHRDPNKDEPELVHSSPTESASATGFTERRDKDDLVRALGGWTHERWKRPTYPNDGCDGGPHVPFTAPRAERQRNWRNLEEATNAGQSAFARDFGLALTPRHGAHLGRIRTKPKRHTRAGFGVSDKYGIPGFDEYSTLDHRRGFRLEGERTISVIVSMPYGPHAGRHGLIERASDLIAACAGIGVEVRAFAWTWWHPHTFGLVFWSTARTDLTVMFESSAGYISRVEPGPAILPNREG